MTDELDETAIEGDPGVAEVSNGDLLSSFLLAGYACIPQANSTTYDEMIGAGALGSIDDANFKRELANYYSRMAAGTRWNALLRDEQMACNAALRGTLRAREYVGSGSGLAGRTPVRSRRFPAQRDVGLVGTTRLWPAASIRPDARGSGVREQDAMRLPTRGRQPRMA